MVRSRAQFNFIFPAVPELFKNVGGDPLHMLTMVTRHEKQYERPTQTPGGGSALIIIDPGAEDWQDTTRNGCTSIALNSMTFHRGQGYEGVYTATQQCEPLSDFHVKSINNSEIKRKGCE
ncbi:hypothetical protein llap_2605 [Limosa lapponica baueri]|uniref:Uncharacterized protein n=1 Tax=Limosa lapponica baueri TaxID=1758121 RepID=A0A2I0UM29_LIMLA|nr:hypothetical protein llap_2605 [Limosa lapponica baueri]